MICYKYPLFLFYILVFGAMHLIACSKKQQVVPVVISDDRVVGFIEKEILLLEADLVKVNGHLASSKKSMAENTMRPKILDYERREYFRYEKMARQIEQQIAYYKIRRSLRLKDVELRLGKITHEDLKREANEYSISSEANKHKFVWRDLEPPAAEKAAPPPKKEDSGAHH